MVLMPSLLRLDMSGLLRALISESVFKLINFSYFQICACTRHSSKGTRISTTSEKNYVQVHISRKLLNFFFIVNTFNTVNPHHIRYFA